jgi:hypothetical protein
VPVPGSKFQPCIVLHLACKLPKPGTQWALDKNVTGSTLIDTPHNSLPKSEADFQNLGQTPGCVVSCEDRLLS